MNQIVLIGNLTKSPEARSKSDFQVSEFTVAVSRRNQAEETDFIRVTAFNNLASACNRYLDKGSKVAVIGTLRIESYESREGEKRQSVKVVASSVEFLSKREEHTREGNLTMERDKRAVPMQQSLEDIPF